MPVHSRRGLNKEKQVPSSRSRASTSASAGSPSRAGTKADGGKCQLLPRSRDGSCRDRLCASSSPRLPGLSGDGHSGHSHGLHGQGEPSANVFTEMMHEIEVPHSIISAHAKCSIGHFDCPIDMMRSRSISEKLPRHETHYEHLYETHYKHHPTQSRPLRPSSQPCACHSVHDRAGFRCNPFSQAAQLTWSGGGGDANWSTGTNWAERPDRSRCSHLCGQHQFNHQQ